MQSGIKVKCNKTFGQFMITEKPYCTINDAEKRQLEWGKETFIPLQPKVPHRIVIQFPYSEYPHRACGLASITALLNPDEVQSYEYKAPIIVYHSGKLMRIS